MTVPGRGDRVLRTRAPAASTHQPAAVSSPSRALSARSNSRRSCRRPRCSSRAAAWRSGHCRGPSGTRPRSPRWPPRSSARRSRGSARPGTAARARAPRGRRGPAVPRPRRTAAPACRGRIRGSRALVLRELLTVCRKPAGTCTQLDHDPASADRTSEPRPCRVPRQGGTGSSAVAVDRLSCTRGCTSVLRPLTSQTRGFRGLLRSSRSDPLAGS
jgi:hypothetical protein